MQNSEWANLNYMNPTELLLGMDEMLDASGIKKYKNASDILLNRRTRDLAEDRRCAIFCHGAGQALGTDILFAPYDEPEFDYVGAYKYGNNVMTFPIEMKQLAPDRFKPLTCLQTQISKLRKYADTRLVVAIHINRMIHIKPQELDVTGVRVKEIWLYGQLQNDAANWLLCGNLMSGNPKAYTFQLPAT